MDLESLWFKPALENPRGKHLLKAECQSLTVAFPIRDQDPFTPSQPSPRALLFTPAQRQLQESCISPGFRLGFQAGLLSPFSYPVLRSGYSITENRKRKKKQNQFCCNWWLRQVENTQSTIPAAVFLRSCTGFQALNPPMAYRKLLLHQNS